MFMVSHGSTCRNRNGAWGSQGQGATHACLKSRGVCNKPGFAHCFWHMRGARARKCGTHRLAVHKLATAGRPVVVVHMRLAAACFAYQYAALGAPKQVLERLRQQ